MKIIPFNPKVSSIQEFSVNLGELVCDFHFSWNERAGRWFCDFQTSEGGNYSVQLVENSPLLGNFNRTGLSGDFRILKTSRSADERISYDSFGSDWKMFYGSAEEWIKFDSM